MQTLLEMYEQEKLAEATVAAPAEAPVVEEAEKIASAEELELIEKYASMANDLLAKDYGKDYVDDDVVELATLLIKHDEELVQEAEKTAALEEIGKVIAKGFLAEIKQNN